MNRIKQPYGKVKGLYNLQEKCYKKNMMRALKLQNKDNSLINSLKVKGLIIYPSPYSKSYAPNET